MENILISVTIMIALILSLIAVFFSGYVLFSNREIKKGMGQLAVAINKSIKYSKDTDKLAKSNEGHIEILNQKDTKSRERDRSLSEHAQRMTLVINAIAVSVNIKERVTGSPSITKPARKVPTAKKKVSSEKKADTDIKPKPKKKTATKKKVTLTKKKSGKA